MALTERSKIFQKDNPWKTVVMGRKTFQSLELTPLPKRNNIVLTSLEMTDWADVKFVSNIEVILEQSKIDDIYIIGGANVYEQFMPYADFIFKTKIHHDFKVDTYAPVLDDRIWSLEERVCGITDDRNIYIHYFEKYMRKINVANVVELPSGSSTFLFLFSSKCAIIYLRGDKDESKSQIRRFGIIPIR